MVRCTPAGSQSLGGRDRGRIQEPGCLEGSQSQRVFARQGLGPGKGRSHSRGVAQSRRKGEYPGFFLHCSPISHRPCYPGAADMEACRGSVSRGSEWEKVGMDLRSNRLRSTKAFQNLASPDVEPWWNLGCPRKAQSSNSYGTPTVYPTLVPGGRLGKRPECCKYMFTIAADDLLSRKAARWFNAAGNHRAGQQ